MCVGFYLEFLQLLVLLPLLLLDHLSLAELWPVYTITRSLPNLLPVVFMKYT